MENLFVTLFSLAIILYSWSEAAPSHYIDERQLDQADGPDDDRWRLVSGLETAYLYTQKLGEQIRACDNEPLISAGADLKAILNGVCQLMAVQELTGKVSNESDLHTILKENILDSCHWLNHLIENEEVMASERFLELNDTCEIGYMPRLTQYCLETRLDSFYTDIYRPASDFYADTVVNQDIPMWLDSSLTQETKESVFATLGWTSKQNVTCPF